MSKITWITPTGSLGKIAEEDYFEFQLDAVDTAGYGLTYTVVAGKLSNGLQLFKNGLIQGIPVIESSSLTIQEYTQTFTVRAKSVTGKIADRTFNITVNSIALPTITPKNLSLGTFFDGSYLDIQLVALDPNPTAKLVWKVLDGELPQGTTLTADGRLSGYMIPYYSPAATGLLGWGITGWDFISWDTATAAGQSKKYKFKIQVFDGSRYDESTYYISVLAKGTFTADNVVLNSSDTSTDVSFDNKHLPFITTLPQEFPSQRQQSNFAFKINGFDIGGANILFDFILSGEDRFDQGGYWSPNPIPPTPGEPGYPNYGYLIPDQPDENGNSYPVSGFDAEGFDQESKALPPGIDMNIFKQTGWLTGKLGVQSEVSKSYKFQVLCYNEDYPALTSEPVLFTLTVLGDLTNTVEWATPSDLGVIDNGDISEFAIVATSSKGKPLTFRLQPGSEDPINPNRPDQYVVTYTPTARSKLPQGLQLLPNGLIIGRPTFEYFSMDGGSTTIDKKSTVFDTEYVFTVSATDETDDVLGTITDSKTFKIKVNNYNNKPYENIYLRALPSVQQRLDFYNLVNNQDIFPDQLMYRASDPWFGKAKDIKFLFAAGLDPNNATAYITAMEQNHYNKRIDLGTVKTAVLLDDNYNVKYEVVYVEVLDQDQGIAKVINRTSQVKPPYNTSPFTQIYPNSLNNMNAGVTSLGYANKGSLPHWMTHPQEDGRVLGFTRGVVLAYTVPGASKLIAYRLQQTNTKFNSIDFVADRYQLDHFLSLNYNIPDKKFIESLETTFDRLPATGVLHPYAGSVNFAVTIPFDEINGRTLEYIKRTGGVDGSTQLKSGQRLVFVRQEQFGNVATAPTFREAYDETNFDLNAFNFSLVPGSYTSENDGWNSTDSLYASDPIGNLPYDSSSVIPGFIEMSLSHAVNQRGGIWEIQITAENVIKLVFIQEVQLNEFVLVAGGSNYGNTKLYYDPIIKPGFSVPAYSVLTNKLNTAMNSTRYDGGATRFLNNRDQYALPETKDIWLKFPRFDIYK